MSDHHASSNVNSKGGFYYCSYERGLTTEFLVYPQRHRVDYGVRPVHLLVGRLPAHKTRLAKGDPTSAQGHRARQFLPGQWTRIGHRRVVLEAVKRTDVARREPHRRGQNGGAPDRNGRGDGRPSLRKQAVTRFHPPVLSRPCGNRYNRPVNGASRDPSSRRATSCHA